MTLLSPDMTDAERRLIVAAIRGGAIDLGGARVRGSVLADLITSARPGWVLPRAGLELSRLVVSGGLDLSAASISAPLTFLDVTFEAKTTAEADAASEANDTAERYGTSAAAGTAEDRAPGEALVLRDARLAGLAIQASRIVGAVIADRIEVTGNLLIGETDIAGAVQARAAVIGGAFALEANVVGAGGVAMHAAGMRVAGPMVLRRSTFRGAVSLHRVRLGGGLQAEDATFDSESVRALDLTGAACSGDLVVERARIGGGLVLAGARIEGHVLARGVVVGDAGCDASACVVAHGLSLAGARLAGVLNLTGAHVGNDIGAAGIEIHGGSTSIRARLARIGGSIDLDAAKLVGTVEIATADIAGDVRFSNARLFGANAALDAASVRVGGDVTMMRAVVQGHVGLAASRIAGRLVASAASLKVDRGVSLDATGAHVGRGVDLDNGLHAIGGIVLDHARVETAAVILSGSQIASIVQGGPLTTALASSAEPHRPGLPALRRQLATGDDDSLALSLAGAHVACLVMPDRAEQRPRGIVDLSQARVGDYVDFAAGWPPPHSAARAPSGRRKADHLVLDGFTYARLAHPSGEAVQVSLFVGEVSTRDATGRARIAWLETQAQEELAHRVGIGPWQQLAATLAAQGHTAAAREVTVAGRRRQRNATTTGAGPRWASRLDDALTQFGFAPWRPLAALLVLLVGFALLFGWAERQCAAAPCEEGRAFVTIGDARGAPAFNALGYSLDALVPLLDLGYTRHWRADPEWRPLWLLSRTPAAATTPAPAVAPDIVPRLTFGGLLALARVLESILGLGLLGVWLAALIRSRRFGG